MNGIVVVLLLLLVASVVGSGIGRMLGKRRNRLDADTDRFFDELAQSQGVRSDTRGKTAEGQKSQDESGRYNYGPETSKLGPPPPPPTSSL